MSGGKIMNETIEYALRAFTMFVSLLPEKGIEVKAFQDTYNKEKFQYVIPYHENMVYFLNDISGIPIDITKQFIALNKLRYIVNALPENIYFHVTVDGNNLSIKLGNNIFRYNILGIDIYEKRGVIVSFTYRNKMINKDFTYVDAYNKILKEIKESLNPRIVDSLSFLEFYRNSTNNVIQNKLNHADIFYCSHSQFCKNYNKPEDEMIFFILQENFDHFIKDMFPERTYKKLVQLMNLCKFNFYLSDRDTDLPVKIIFPRISKYINYNNIVVFEFLDVTIAVVDDGNFSYEDPTKDIPVYLDDIDDIYNYLLDETKQKISLMVGTPTEGLSKRDIELYKILVY